MAKTSTPRAQRAPAKPKAAAPAAPVAEPRSVVEAVGVVAPAIEIPAASGAEAKPEGAAEEGKQPEETALPPVADDLDGHALVVTGPEKGRRRAGFAFGREPLVLTPNDFKEGVDSARDYVARVLAVIEDPALRCFARLPDGTERAISPEEIEALRRELAEDASA